MSAVASVAVHLARRGWEATKRDEPEQPEQPEQPPAASLWALLILFLSIVVFSVTVLLTQYTYGNLVSTLAAVEDPKPDVYVRIDNPPDYEAVTQNNNDDDNNHDAENPAPQHIPITSSLRRTVAHIQARGGRWGRFRGLLLYILMVLCARIFATVAVSAGVFGGGPIAHSAALFLGFILLANLEMGWIHIVISEPSSRPFYRRIPGPKAWLKIAPAAAVRYFASQLCAVIIMVVGIAVNIWKPGNAAQPVMITEDQSPTKLLIGSLLLIGLGVILYLLIQVPAKVAFIRVAASMLPEEDEAIVPFDRSFGSKVTPEIVGGSGKVGIVEAWRSFDWGSRIRFVKVVVKATLLVIAVTMVMWVVLGIEAALFLPSGWHQGINNGPQ